MVYKIGKNAVKMHRKTLSFEKYVGDALPTVPEKVYWGYKVPDDAWGMLGNDVAGCCVVAMAMHMDMNWTAHTGTMRKWTTDQALQVYSELTGFDPKTGNNDTGLSMVDFMGYWQSTGLFGNKILGWMQFNTATPNRFDQAIWLYGGAAIGVQFPQSAMDQFNRGETWKVVPGSPVNGGHALPFFNKGALGKKCRTWAKEQAVLNAWLDNYVDEGYAPISDAWFDTVDVAPNHFKKDLLWKDLKAMAA